MTFFVQCCLLELWNSVQGVGDDVTHCLCSVDMGRWLMKDEDKGKSEQHVKVKQQFCGEAHSESSCAVEVLILLKKYKHRG